jgi:sec-independent protein translocase protein TatC
MVSRTSGRQPFRTYRDEMPFLDHLEELRWRLLWSVIAVLIATVIGFFIVTRLNVLGFLIVPIEPFLEGSRLKYLSPMEPFFITLKLAVTLGVILASPVVVYQIWAFLSPALLPSEKRTIVPALYFGLLLFLAGVAMAYYVVLPLTLNFSMGFQTEALEQNIVVSEYLSVVTRLLIAFGLVFELPVVITVLAALGLVTPDFLASKRRHAIAVITIGSSLITPGDVMSTIIMMIPLIFLYEVSIAVSRVLYRRRAAAAAAAEA